jgi:hypothetical protein
MNAFYEHHRDSIRFGYRCFDRALLNGLIQPFQQPERVVGFFATYRRLYPVSRDVLRGAAEQFQCWVKDQADKWNAPIVEAPKGRRDEFVDPYFKGAKPDHLAFRMTTPPQSITIISIFSRIFSRHLSIAVNSNGWPNPPSPRPANAFSEGMIAWPVSARVGNVKNNDRGLVEPIVLT